MVFSKAGRGRNTKSSSSVGMTLLSHDVKYETAGERAKREKQAMKGRAGGEFLRRIETDSEMTRTV